MAVKEFLEKLKSRELFNALNEVYSEPESLEETSLREKSKGDVLLTTLPMTLFQFL